MYQVLSGGLTKMPKGNPNPKHKLTRLYDEPVAETAVSVKLPKELDIWVRSLPNRAEWLRRAIADAYERDMAAIKGTDSDAIGDTQS